MNSSTQTIPAYTRVPRHVAVIMDGNGRWAKKRFLPRVMGHKKGLDALEDLCRTCAEAGIPYLTVFAFSTENWRRPADEVSFLMGLFLAALQKKVAKMHANGLRVKVIGDRSRFPAEIQAGIRDAEALTAANTGLTLTIAADYGGRWDILQAGNALLRERAAKGVPPDQPVTEAELASHLSLAYAPEPDLFIRTGGEQRISNFLLWQLAYTELYFCECFWPEFNDERLQEAIQWYGQRERRFGRTSVQTRQDAAR